MNDLKNVVKDIFTKNLSTAKESIFSMLQAKAVEKIDSIKPHVGNNLLKCEEEVSSDDDDEDEDESDITELQTIKKRIDPAARRDSAKYYKKNRIKIKQGQKKYKKSALGKRTVQKSTRMKKVGKTSTGKRISTIINKNKLKR